MPLGISSYTYPWRVGVPGYAAPPHPMTPLNLLDQAVALGVRLVQFADHTPLHRPADAAAYDRQTARGAPRGPRPGRASSAASSDAVEPHSPGPRPSRDRYRN